jgi:hypothetical protein
MAAVPEEAHTDLAAEAAHNVVAEVDIAGHSPGEAGIADSALGAGHNLVAEADMANVKVGGIGLAVVHILVLAVEVVLLEVDQ